MLIRLTTSRQNHDRSIGQYLHKPGVRDVASLAEFPPIVIRNPEWREEPIPNTAADHPGEAGGHAAQRNSLDRSERGVPMRTRAPMPTVTPQSLQLLAGDPN